MVQNKFKVIIVGGGPVGLTAAHVLSRAGIEYVVLERRSSIQIDVGASLALWPQGLRVLSQLGLLERLQELGEEMGRTATVTLEGHKYKETWATETMKTKSVRHISSQLSYSSTKLSLQSWSRADRLSPGRHSGSII